MVSERQRLARKRFKEANPELFQKSDPLPKDPNKKSKNKIRNKKFKPQKGGDERKSNTFRKHPLRVPGMKPGESCFICKAQDHIAKLCPKKSEWEKNKICLLCRRRGHSLKNCPNKNDSVEKKYCYNCGEVGHSLSNCSHPLQDGGTKFANCFICNESGHLSKNCPKNTHGIYPKGGSCKICGGVTHLAKDCPNKGNRDTFAAGEPGNNRTSRGYGERWQGQITKFISGDDLDDDFITDDAKNGKKDDTMSHQETDSVSIGVEAEKNIKPKKKQGPKVVNFMG
ncbi:VASCULAR-RELATED NAC-DOMAIN 6 [Tasmannia lanceolata]|uniref:VASCULAR-RELATED NAC-DOMAIN 6 n=1 Tax=Tasmannia lanceolata TaxID=3420 RepID=UPI00406427CE